MLADIAGAKFAKSFSERGLMFCLWPSFFIFQGCLQLRGHTFELSEMISGAKVLQAGRVDDWFRYASP